MNNLLPRGGDYSRRQAISQAALWVLAGTSPLAAAVPNSGFRFVVVNDLHYRDQRCGPWLEKVVTSIRALRPAPEFCLLAGDLSESGTLAQLGAVREIFQGTRRPVRAVIGNHDYEADRGRRSYRDIFGTSFNFQFSHSGWRFLALDTTEGQGVYRTQISQQTLAWADRSVADLPKSEPLVVFSHFPLGRNWLRPRNAPALVKSLGRANLQAVLSGHWHGMTEVSAGRARLSTGRCCSWWRTNHDGSPKKGYMLCEATAVGLSRRFIAVE